MLRLKDLTHLGTHLEVRLIGLSCDSLEQHRAWAKDVLATIDVDQEDWE